MPSIRSRMFVPLVFALLVWEGIARFGLVDPALFPPPTRVASALYAMIMSGEMARDVEASYLRLFAGLMAGTLAGAMLGLLTGRNPRISDAVTPILQVFRPLPPVAIIPLIIVWLGIGEVAKVFSIGFAAFFPMWLNTHLGAQQIPEKLLWCASTLTHSRRRLFFEVALPATLPFMAVGFRSAISVAFVMVFVSELAGASKGIGYEIQTASLSYRADRMIAALFVLGVSGALADSLFSLVLARACPWLKSSRANS